MKSIYKYAAEAGVPAGLYLTAVSGCFLLSMRADFLSMLVFPLLVCFPVVLWALMRRVAAEEPSYRKVSALWLCGLYIVIFGTLICSLFSALYLVLCDPGFVGSYVGYALDRIETSPFAADYASATSVMHEAIDARILPSATEFVSTMGWLTCFAGSILSLFLSLILARKPQVRMGHDRWSGQ